VSRSGESLHELTCTKVITTRYDVWRAAQIETFVELLR
jgi:hypothetical protein